jgi:hypothetical protein
MARERANDLRAFIDEQLRSGEGDLTPEEALACWEDVNAPEEEREATLRAIRRGLDDMSAGRTRPFEELDREFRERHGLPPRS